MIPLRASSAVCYVSCLRRLLIELGGGVQENVGPSMTAHLEVDLADMYTGRTVEVSSALFSGAAVLIC